VNGLCAFESGAAAFNDTSISAVAIVGLPRERASIAVALGLLDGQLAETRGEALEGELDLPPGFWRVWPSTGIGLWVGRDASPPPLTRVGSMLTLDLSGTVRRLGEYGIWPYEGRALRDGRWTPPLPLKPLYEHLLAGADAFHGSFGDEGGRSEEALFERAGRLRMRRPEQAVRWLEIASGLHNDGPFRPQRT
jgi:hypothetical protein